MSTRTDYPEWVVSLAKKCAEMTEGPEAGWGIYAELIWAYVPFDVKQDWKNEPNEHLLKAARVHARLSRDES